MDLNLLNRDADDLIRKVVSRYNQLYVPAGNFSQLELDLMLDDLRKLYDTFKTIGQVHLTLQNETVKQEVSVNAHVPAASTYETAAMPASAEKTYRAPETTPTFFQPDPEPEPEPETEIVADSEHEAELETEPDPITELEVKAPAAEVEANETPVAEALVYEPVLEKPVPAEPVISYVEKPVQETTENSIPVVNAESTTSMLADRFNSGSKSLSETIASTQTQGVMGSKLLLQPLTDLSSGIGLNDKFHFISELFSNNPTQYQEAITRINKAVNIDEAGWILQKYHTAEWAQKAETLARLKDFIKRRFI